MGCGPLIAPTGSAAWMCCTAMSASGAQRWPIIRVSYGCHQERVFETALPASLMTSVTGVLFGIRLTQKPRGRFQAVTRKGVCYDCKHTDCNKDRGTPRPTCWTHSGPGRVTGPSTLRRGRVCRVLLTASLARSLENDGLATARAW